MKNISTGFGLCVLGLGIAAWPVLDRLVPSANASAVTAAAAAVSTAAAGQATPTIVWYGAAPMSGSGSTATGTGTISWPYQVIYRAWSDGRIEARKMCTGGGCDGSVTASGPWILVSSPSEGLTFRSDINFDAKVDGADLGQLLTDWGDAPRHDIPPSDCPLALINP